MQICALPKKKNKSKNSLYSSGDDWKVLLNRKEWEQTSPWRWRCIKVSKSKNSHVRSSIRSGCIGLFVKVVSLHCKEVWGAKLKNQRQQKHMLPVLTVLQFSLTWPSGDTTHVDSGHAMAPFASFPGVPTQLISTQFHFFFIAIECSFSKVAWKSFDVIFM